MSSETFRIAHQLRHAFAGDPWHGSSLRDLLAGVTAEQAHARPVASAHTLGELVLHIDIYVHAAAQAISGVPLPHLFGTEKDWPALPAGAAAWHSAVDTLLERGESLARAIENFPADRLSQQVPGREYNFYHLFHGIVQHSLYHGGQIALLKKAVSALEV